MTNKWNTLTSRRRKKTSTTTKNGFKSMIQKTRRFVEKLCIKTKFYNFIFRKKIICWFCFFLYSLLCAINFDNNDIRFIQLMCFFCVVLIVVQLLLLFSYNIYISCVSCFVRLLFISDNIQNSSD